MLTNREIEMHMKAGQDYLNELHKRIEQGKATLKELEEISERHKIHPNILATLVLVGAIHATVQDLIDLSPVRVYFLEYNVSYSLDWNLPDDCSIPFFLKAMSILQDRFDAYLMSSAILKKQLLNHCKRCELMLPVTSTKQYCSEKCEELDHYFDKVQKPQVSQWESMKEHFRLIRESMRDLFNSF
jgi:predicted nucleic acid-binding Zn ribbon protein